MKWQPIATAPKDGRDLVLYDPIDLGYIYHCRWYHGAWETYGMDRWRPGQAWRKLSAPEDVTHWLEITEPKEAK